MSPTTRATIIVLAYSTILTIGELTLAYHDLVTGTVIHAALLFALLGHYALRHGTAYGGMLLALALLPLLRILSVAMPLPEVAPIYWHALVGVPLLGGLGYATALLGGPRRAWGWERGAWRAGALVALGGVPLGYVAYRVMRPEPPFASSDTLQLVLGGAILVLFVSVPEELLFRGLLQQAGRELFGPHTVTASSALYAIMYVGTLDGATVVFMALVGLLFGRIAYRTHSLWGVILAHGVMLIEAFLVFPLTIP